MTATRATARTERVEGHLELPGHHVAGPSTVVAPDGSALVLLNPPARRRWSASGVLLAAQEIGWRLVEDGPAVRIEVDEPCEVDLLALPPSAAAAMSVDWSEAMLVPGSFAPLEGPASLGRFLVGSQVLDTNLFDGRRCPSEQTALAVYRVARWRGGELWDAVADVVAELVARRVEGSPDGLLVHDLWGRGETHVRFLADAALLLLAQSERAPDDPRWRTLADRACDALDLLTVPHGSGVWHLHDSLELDAGRNDLVLNTHLQVMVVRLAFGRDVTAGSGPLREVLRVPPPRARAIAIGATAFAATAVAARANGRTAARAERLVERARHAAEAASAGADGLRFPGGWTGRDASGRPAPPYYLTVNLNDLASLLRNRDVPEARHALRTGLRFARAGYLRWQRRHRDPIVVLQPALLRNAGLGTAADAVASELVRDGHAPAIGWPGRTDRLWSRLAEGTP
ncbi:MAG: hypothetical protein ACRDYW_08555 [Acidimicrobiales bacterium]